MNENTEKNRNNAVLGGILILIGSIFLLQNMTNFNIGNWNWWALFILIPALGSLSRAWAVYRTEGQANEAVRGPLVGGVVLLLVTSMLLFNLSWGMLWPLFLIIFGVAALIFRN